MMPFCVTLLLSFIVRLYSQFFSFFFFFLSSLFLFFNGLPITWTFTSRSDPYSVLAVEACLFVFLNLYPDQIYSQRNVLLGTESSRSKNLIVTFDNLVDRQGSSIWWWIELVSLRRPLRQVKDSIHFLRRISRYTRRNATCYFFCETESGGPEIKKKKNRILFRYY